MIRHPSELEWVEKLYENRLEPDKLIIMISARKSILEQGKASGQGHPLVLTLIQGLEQISKFQSEEGLIATEVLKIYRGDTQVLLDALEQISKFQSEEGLIATEVLKIYRGDTQVLLDALEQISKESSEEVGCYWTNKKNISRARKALAIYRGEVT